MSNVLIAELIHAAADAAREIDRLSGTCRQLRDDVDVLDMLLNEERAS